MIDLTTFDDFEAASRATLAYLHQRLGFDLWMMTRIEGSNCIVLQAENHGYNVEEGTVFRWGDSFCSEMVLGRAPRVALRAQDVPLFVQSVANWPTSPDWRLHRRAIDKYRWLTVRNVVRDRSKATKRIDKR